MVSSSIENNIFQQFLCQYWRFHFAGVFQEQSMPDYYLPPIISVGGCLLQFIRRLNCSSRRRDALTWQRKKFFGEVGAIKFTKLLLSHNYVIFLVFGIGKVHTMVIYLNGYESAWKNSWSISKSWSEYTTVLPANGRWWPFQHSISSWLFIQFFFNEDEEICLYLKVAFLLDGWEKTIWWY